MIYVERNIIPLPEVFYSKEVEIAKKRLEEFYLSSEGNKSQKRFSTPFNEKISNEVKYSLKELFKHKCAYCESLLPPAATQGYLDHFRPKSGARGLEREFSTDYYWWLSYEWRNMYYSCPMCDRYKSTWFPLEGSRVNILTPYEETIFKEKALLIDPCNDRPEDHLIYDEDGKVDFLTSKGKTTIEILKLNRHELVEARSLKLKDLYGEWELFTKLFRREKTNRKKIKKIAEDWELLFTQFSENPYLGIQRYMLSKWIANNPDVQGYLSNREYNQEFIKEYITLKETSKYLENFQSIEQLNEEEKKLIEERLNIDQLKHVYIEKIEINNFKCFSNIQINLNDSNIKEITNQLENTVIKKEPWLLFLGENGVGKSSLLKAIVIGLCGGEYLKKLEIKGGDILKYGTESGYIKIHIVGEQEPIEVIFNKTEIITSNDLPIVNIVAYNSIRLGPIKRKLIPETNIFKNVKVKNLFDYSSSLIDADAWLLNRNQQIFDRVALTLKDLMMLDENDKIEIFEKQIFVKKENGQRIAINDLSDGYQSVYLLSIDIMASFVGEKTNFDLVEGMVIIDEIGTHLHPRWRMEVVERLRNAFPKIQFVVTTHEPLCLRGLKAGETTVLTKNTENEVIALTELPDPSQLRVDQILTSDFFGLKSTIDPETERRFDEYYAILALDEIDRSEEQKNHLLELSQTIPRIKHLGDTEREELTYYVIDELLARKIREDGIKIKEELKAEALKRVESIWKTMDTKK
ncbi:AAA family ATPase [Empedobacter tilapiae]|uniref:AAA family ATPase n=1 Tax=Empedobacter tilapiae TaxID=2491114 RepID=UPI0028D3BB94|nr:AAA family ATPase [Empedobacter tilapiae]